jgi:hypothetical protein
MICRSFQTRIFKTYATQFLGGDYRHTQSQTGNIAPGSQFGLINRKNPNYFSFYFSGDGCKI